MLLSGTRSEQDQIWNTWFTVRFPAGGGDQTESPGCVWRPLLDTEAAELKAGAGDSAAPSGLCVCVCLVKHVI